MQGMKKRSAHAALIPAALVACLMTAGTANANETPPPVTGGDKHGHDIGAYAVRYSPETPPPGNPLTPTTTWTPPACWMAPVATPAELKAEREAIWALGSTGADWEAAQRDYYVNGNPHKDFELANTGKGLWWNGTPNPNRTGDPKALSCYQEYDEWVPKGDPPKTGPPAITPEILAQSAYDRIRIPDTEISLSPDVLAKQTVNLNTWAWLDKEDFAPVSVTASLPVLGISATTTATPIGLHLDAGTPDADLFPASGDCPRNSDGSIGTPYRSGDGGRTPPCGLVYRRSSNGGTFPLRATVTWRVTWVGTTGGGTLDNGSFDRTTDITVREIQSVVR